MRFRKYLDKILEALLVIIMSVLVLDVLWQVASRYILTSPSSFTDELAGFLLIWAGLLGAAYVAGKNEHLAIDILLQKTRSTRKKALLTFINLLVIFFALTVMITGGIWLVYTRFLWDVKSAALELQLGYVYLVIPLSGILILYYSSYNIISLYQNKNNLS